MSGHLALASLAADLAGSLYNLLAAAGARWVQLSGGKLTAVGVDGEIPLVGTVNRIQPIADLALGAEARILEAHGL